MVKRLHMVVESLILVAVLALHGSSEANTQNTMRKQLESYDQLLNDNVFDLCRNDTHPSILKEMREILK